MLLRIRPRAPSPFVGLLRPLPACFAAASSSTEAAAAAAGRHIPHRSAAAFFSHQAAMHNKFSAIVVGAGPSGIAVVGNLLDSLPSLTSSAAASSSSSPLPSSSSSSTTSTPSIPASPTFSSSSPTAAPTQPRIAWVDPAFGGGRINDKYREVPSNTKVNLFLDYASATGVFRQVLTQTPTPNAVTRLQELPQDETCSLGFAGDVLLQLTSGMVADERIQSVRGKVTHASWDPDAREWTVTVRNNCSSDVAGMETGTETETHTAPMLVYCTGAAPATVPLPVDTPQPLDLDVALAPSVLVHAVPADRPITVGVVGASHSAVLVLMNLVTLAKSTHPRLRVRWFTRHATLRFAEYKDGWILYDNTGLKGHAAQFAREQLDGAALAASEAGRFVTRVDCSGGPASEQDAFRRELPACDLVVQAVGYSNHTLPRMEAEVRFDHDGGGFVDARTGEVVAGLFGGGIAFPERVVDPAGNVEYAVGFWKFMRFLKKVVPQWVEKSRV